MGIKDLTPITDYALPGFALSAFIRVYPRPIIAFKIDHVFSMPLGLLEQP
jgi:hypothetical protein